MGTVLAFAARASEARGRPARLDAVTEAEAAPAAAGDLVRRIAAGDRHAEDELVQQFGEGLRFLLRRWTRDHEAADEVYQESFRRAIEKLRRGELRDPESLPAFLRGLAKNLSTDHYRARSRRSHREIPMNDAHDPPDERAEHLGRLLREERVGLIRRLIGELPRERDREVLLRFYLEEEERQRIQTDLGLTSAELNVVLCRARRRCQALFEQAFRDGGA